MKRTIAAVLVIGLFLISAALGQSSKSSPMPKLQDYGRGDKPGPPQPSPKAMNGQGYFWSAEDMKKTFAVNNSNVAMGHFVWTPEYRLSIVQRPYAPPDKASS